jgi:flagellar biosynthesis protein
VEILAKVPVGDEIPVELYQAVAEILAFVYGLNKKQ